MQMNLYSKQEQTELENKLLVTKVGEGEREISMGLEIHTTIHKTD